MANEELIKRWSVGPLDCQVWISADPTIIHGGVRRAEVPVGTVQVLRSFGDGRAEAVVTAMAAELRRPTGAWYIDHEPITDFVVVPCPGQLRRDQVDHLARPFELTHDLTIIPVGVELRDAVFEACDPPGTGRGLSIDVRGQPLYAFARAKPPREDPYTWDKDNRLQMCVALSRLVRPTSVALHYAVRIIGTLGAERFEVRPGPVRGFGADAWTSVPERDWLAPQDMVRLRELMAAFDAEPFEPRSRIGRAFWYSEYAARTSLVDMRWSLVATALETLLGTHGDRSTQQFIRRVPQLAAAIARPGISNAEARRMWGLRSSLVHGEKHGGLGPKDLALYVRMEDLLRETLRRAVIDVGFRTKVASSEAVDASFPLPQKQPRHATCPKCGDVFDPAKAAAGRDTPPPPSHSGKSPAKRAPAS